MEIQANKELTGTGVQRWDQRGTTRTADSTGEALYTYRVNPNKYLFGDDGYINSWQEFVEAFNSLMADNNADCTVIRRVDFRIDNYEHDYLEMYPINNVVAHALTMFLNCGNIYSSSNFGAGERHNMVNHNKRTGEEFECYDRQKISGNFGPTKTRFEFRDTRANLNDISQVAELGRYWISLFDSMAKNKGVKYSQFQEIQNQLNDNLCELWQKRKSENRIRDTIGFFADQRVEIITAAQFKALCSRIGLSGNTAYAYKSRLNLDYLSNDEYIQYLFKFRDSLIQFFSK